jgi:hypothetical protein
MSFIPSCPEVQQNLTEYLEGALPWRRRLGIWLHLLHCHVCDALRKALLALPALSKQILDTPKEAPREANEALLAVLDRLNRPRTKDS